MGVKHWMIYCTWPNKKKPKKPDTWKKTKPCSHMNSLREHPDISVFSSYMISNILGNSTVTYIISILVQLVTLRYFSYRYIIYIYTYSYIYIYVYIYRYISSFLSNNIPLGNTDHLLSLSPSMDIAIYYRNRMEFATDILGVR
jgi:hypothetical protein